MKREKKIDFRRFNKTTLLPKQEEGKSFKDRNFKEDKDSLQMAYRAWDELQSFRENRIRNRDYTFGRQWNDLITLSDGRTMTEEQYLKEQGKVPLKNNLIRQLVKNIVGQFRSMRTQPVCVARDRKEQTLGEVLSNAVEYAHQHNRLWELDGRTLEEFVISGSCAHKILYETRNGKTDVWVDEVTPSRLFFNQMSDIRHSDCNLIGELHDMPIADLLSRYANGNRERAVALRQIYSDVRDAEFERRYRTLSREPIDNIDFYTPSENNMCRVIEVWHHESRERLKCHDTLSGTIYKAEITELGDIDAENARRIKEASEQGIEKGQVPLINTEWFIDKIWYCRHLSPLGHILEEGETPYWHGSHPYVIKLYPLMDGEVHSLVEDVIDQQRYINRMITMLDFIMGSSAKGVLLFPEDQIPDGMTIRDVMEEWTRYNGIIMYRPRPGSPVPQQISVNGTNVGAYDMLSLQMRMFDNISGVHGAMQGKSAPSGTPYALYAQQMQNSSLNLVDLFESFKCFRVDRDTKLVKTIQQYYDIERYKKIAGEDNLEVLDRIGEEEVKNAEFDISITESVSSPVYRIASNEFLLDLFKMGQIDLKMLLENGSFPFADKLLQSLKSC
ncbi:MAG: hypothetical protein IKY54_05880 [Muribaculaceae bacterium]|nr:hypothetical protein [Muribaculaceae bacterium]